MSRHIKLGHLKTFQTPPKPKKVPALTSLEEVVDSFWLSRLSDIREDVETSKYLGSIGSIVSRQKEAFLEDGTSVHVPRAQGLSLVP